MALFNSITCEKGEIYDKIVDLFLGAGWTDIASNSATEFAVLRSFDTNNRPIFFQILPHVGTPSTQDIRTTNSVQIRLNMVRNYTPGNAGVNGVFDRQHNNTVNLLLASNGAALTVPPAAPDIDIYYNISKTRGIIVFDFSNSSAYSTSGGGWFFVGVPDGEIFDRDPRRSCVLANPLNTANNIPVMDHPIQTSVAEGAAVVNHPTMPYVPLRNPDTRGIYAISNIAYGHASTGQRGFLDDMYFISGTTLGLANGDYIEVEDRRFKLILITCLANGPMGSNHYLCVELPKK